MGLSGHARGWLQGQMRFDLSGRWLGERGGGGGGVSS